MLPAPCRTRAVGQQAVERPIAPDARLPSCVDVLDVDEGGLPALLLEDAEGDASVDRSLAELAELAGDREHQVKVNVCRRHNLPAHRRANGIANVRMPS